MRRRDDRAGDDDVARAQPLAVGRERAGHVRDDVDDVADIGLQVLLPRDLRAAPEHEPGEAVELHAGARRVRRAEDHVAMEDVAGERRLHVARRARIEVGKLDRGAERADRRDGRVAAGAARQIRRHVDGDLRLGDRLGPARDRRPCRRSARATSASCSRPAGIVMLSRSIAGLRAEPDLPADRLLARRDARAARGQLLLHAARDARIVPGVGHLCPSGSTS